VSTLSSAPPCLSQYGAAALHSLLLQEEIAKMSVERSESKESSQGGSLERWQGPYWWNSLRLAGAERDPWEEEQQEAWHIRAVDLDVGQVADLEDTLAHAKLEDSIGPSPMSRVRLAEGLLIVYSTWAVLAVEGYLIHQDALEGRKMSEAFLVEGVPGIKYAQMSLARAVGECSILLTGQRWLAPSSHTLPTASVTLLWTVSKLRLLGSGCKLIVARGEHFDGPSLTFDSHGHIGHPSAGRKYALWLLWLA
ncbi:unnamed protein product, partial [Cladocopium goreaui]